jgi:hypothetical protein
MSRNLSPGHTGSSGEDSENESRRRALDDMSRGELTAVRYDTPDPLFHQAHRLCSAFVLSKQKKLR